MAITRRDSNFLATPTRVPLTSARLIENYEKQLDSNVLNVFKAFVKDIDDFHKSIFGITRRFDQMLFIYNNPSEKETDIQEALRMDKYGYFAIGTEYPRWPRARVDVNGALYAIPQYGLWSSSAIVAGAGLYTWGVEVFNPNSDIYKRAATNTKIQITEPGTYDIRANIFARHSGVTVGDPVDLQIRKNAAAIVTMSGAVMTNDLVWVHATKIVNVSKDDLIDVNLVTVGADRYGTADATETWLEICKVN